MGTKVLLGTPLMASSVGLIPAALTSLQVFLLRTEDGEGEGDGCSWCTGISEGLSNGLSCSPSRMQGSVSIPLWGFPMPGVPSHSALCPDKGLSRAGTGSGPRGLLRGAFWWQILGKLQVAERKR